jgi:hypothetical protein
VRHSRGHRGERLEVARSGIGVSRGGVRLGHGPNSGRRNSSDASAERR